MTTLLSRLRREQRGMALVLALGMLVTLAITVTGIIEYTSSNSRAAEVNHGRQDASSIAEAGVNAAYSVLNYWDTTTNAGNNASDPQLLGCNVAGTSCTPRCVGVVVSCPSANADGVAGTASYQGTYDVVKAVWTITSTGYARNPTGAATIKKTIKATSAIVADINNPANVSAWNHLYSTAPQGAGCEVDITNNNVYIDTPMYVTGDLCLSGVYDRIWEQTGGQPVDVRIGGKLVLAGANTSVGYKDPWNNVFPITSAEIAQGCATTSTGAPVACTNPPFSWYVRSTGPFVAVAPPQVTDADADNMYNKADLGPKSPCKAGTSPAGLAAATFDSNTARDNSVATTFTLTPAYSYSCQSASGTGTLAWDDTTNQLTISGSVFIDGSMQITQSGSYTGMGSIYLSGSFTMGGYALAFCAVPSCVFGHWDPNTRMLMIVALGSGTAININGGLDIFQGSLFANPYSTTALNGASAYVQGPLVSGKFQFSQYTLIQPLPTINKLPPGAPLAVNARATPQPPVLTSG